MKKTILSLALLFCVTVSYSQLFNIGVKMGYNSTLSVNNLDYNSQKFTEDFFGNMHFGVFTRLNFGKVYVQPEVLYSMQTKNYKTQSVVDLVNVEFDNVFKTRAIDVPILLGYKVLDLKLMNLRVFAGPKFRFDAGSSLDFKNFSTSINTSEIDKDIKTAKVGLETGLGVDFLMFTFDVRYNLIGNLQEASWEDTKNSFKSLPSSNIIFTLGWKIL